MVAPSTPIARDEVERAIRWTPASSTLAASRGSRSRARGPTPAVLIALATFLAPLLGAGRVVAEPAVGPEPQAAAAPVERASDLLGATGFAAPSPEPRLDPAVRADPIAKLSLRMHRLRRGEAAFDEKLAKEIADLVSDARLIWTVEPAREPDAARALLDVAGAFAEADARLGESQAAAAGLREAALDTLRAHLDSPFAAWLARDVLPASNQPLERRIAAARLLKDQTQPAVKLALLAATGDAEPRIRREVLANLAGWHDPAVHGVFLRELQRELAGDRGAEGALAERHFSQVSSDPEKRFLPELEPLVKGALTAEDWRVAVRAVALSRPFDSNVILPHLIEALALWKTRGARFGHALRLQMEIERELRQRSGRSFGFDVELWRKWYRAARRGELPTTGGFVVGGPAERTKASFFGLRPLSDRIVFVLDRSKSMEVGFGPAAGSQGGYQRRWDEAVHQVLGFLEALGEESRFDLVLFHDYGQAWKGGELVPADARHRDAARDWLRVQVPGGSTAVRSGVETALGIGRDGIFDPARLEADTIVVLCDGDTNEGPAWVRRFLDDINARARVVVYGVQIGVRGDGTLEALAEGSGGEFARILEETK